MENMLMEEDSFSTLQVHVSPPVSLFGFVK
jgi:hypothetical protein